MKNYDSRAGVLYSFIWIQKQNCPAYELHEMRNGSSAYTVYGDIWLAYVLWYDSDGDGDGNVWYDILW